ncbi:hypothetical protein KJ603_01165 [Patescibacteria group bacterium]|nr:hypothetical protein [Patescibacteria group bacterium]
MFLTEMDLQDLKKEIARIKNCPREQKRIEAGHFKLISHLREKKRNKRINLASVKEKYMTF